MASRDLVGRPLVPFFDDDENVNDALQVAEGDNIREEMDVDARVWDKALGYFVYPSEQQASSSSPMAIGAPAKTHRESRTDSGGKSLLTPAMMLSSSAPEQSSSMTTNGNPDQIAADDARVSTRSNSAKRGSRAQKNRSNTPARRRNGKDGGDEASTAPSSSSKKGKNKGGNANNSTGAPGNNGNQQSHKQKDQLSASGKWAWSAFQSSPDPKQLPLPPFLTTPYSGVNTNTPPIEATAPPLPPTPPTPAEPSVAAKAPSLPPGQTVPERLPPAMPTVPPEVATPPPMSIELSMTQDLRRMLNIGGG
ncbi:hypothetical protein BBJ28_00003405 [Nothophytophthora sp. Chile5]|nr:hypothetical protein BBJ28_00003405 [Nothophytophthora sp. Chile5]